MKSRPAHRRARRLSAAQGAAIYGTILLIERDDESFLASAREPWACTVMNLHVDHHPAGLEKAIADFRRLIDHAIEHGGSYFLTYRRWATRSRVEACYPQNAGISATQMQTRSWRAFPKRLVSALQGDVRLTTAWPVAHMAELRSERRLG